MAQLLHGSATTRTGASNTGTSRRGVAFACITTAFSSPNNCRRSTN